MKFSEMPYTRPDKDEILPRLAQFTEQLKNARDFAAANEAFLAEDAYAAGVDTMFSIASVRHTIDTRDQFYIDESDYADETKPLLEEGISAWNRALLNSPFRAFLEKKYGNVVFLNAELDLKAFSPEIIPEMQRENALSTEYDKLVASAQIPFEGKFYTVAQMGPFMKDPDDSRRRAAWNAAGAWFSSQGERLDGIYDEMVRLRDAMGKKLGFGGYTELGYCRLSRNCYGRQEVEAFRDAVRRYVVPVADKIYRRQAERLGKSYPMDYADQALQFRSGNPTPQGTSEDILEQGRKFYHELSPETARFIDFMLDNELMDLLSKPGKAAGGYCTDFPVFKSPFIFANFNGTADDVETITHEAGHAFEVWSAENIVPSSCHWPSMEACEVHSMSMEFFAWPWEMGFFGPDTRKFYYSHLAGALTFIPYGTMVDHFQHIVYEQPDLTPAQRHEVWKQLSAVYMPWLKLDGAIPFFGEGRYWQRQLHIYHTPFYYIDYCLAQTMSLYFWAKSQKNFQAAWEQYYRYTKMAGTKTFTELLSAAGLPSPFVAETLRGVCRKAAEWLDNYDLTGIE